MTINTTVMSMDSYTTWRDSPTSRRYEMNTSFDVTKL